MDILNDTDVSTARRQLIIIHKIITTRIIFKKHFQYLKKMAKSKYLNKNKTW